MNFSIGPPDGWRQELRPLFRVMTPHGWDYIQIDVICKGEHAPGCQAVSEGWICHAACNVEDMPTLTPWPQIVDELVCVREDIKHDKRWRWYFPLGFDWAVVRVSVQHEFRNGRRSMDDHGMLSEKTWYRGHCLTKRTARRQIVAAIENDREETYDDIERA